MLCAGGEAREHLRNRPRHEEAVKSGERCTLLVENHTIGRVFLTETHPDETGFNRAIYRLLAARVDVIRSHAPVRRGRIQVILDADREVPYEHVIGALNACKEAGIEEIELAAAPFLRD